MTELLIRLFVKNPENVKQPDVRQNYGILASIVGIVVNLLLAGGKFLIGTISRSLAITADAVNNLSDAAGSIVTFITVRLSNKPVDEDHPFGHGRMEYLGSLIVGALILVMGVDLLRDGIHSILNPSELILSVPVIIVLAGSILMKLWLYFFYHHIGTKIQNGTLLAAGKDSLSDVLSTSAVLASILATWFFHWKIDGYVGLLVGILVLKAGFEVCRDTLDSLLGTKPDPEKIRAIRELMLECDEIIGVHDLVLHDYGPGRCFASAHAEVNAEMNVLELHEKIDDVERKIGYTLHIPICIHMDPIMETGESVAIKQKLQDYLHQYDERISFHDFRMVPGENHTNLIFDCVVPAGYSDNQRKQLCLSVTGFLKSLNEKYNVVMEFDTDYSGMH